MTKERSLLEPSPLPQEKSLRFALWSGGSVLVAYIGHRFQQNMPVDWRGDGGISDVWSHVGNVPASATAVSATMLVVAASTRTLFRPMSPKQALATASIGFAIGCGANAVFEVPAIADTPFMQTMFPDCRPQYEDFLYGGATALAEATLLSWMATRRAAGNLGLEGQAGIGAAGNP